MRAHEMLRQAWRATLRSTAVFAGDVGRGLLAVSHNTLAMVGLLALVALAFGAGRPDLRHQFEQRQHDPSAQEAGAHRGYGAVERLEQGGAVLDRTVYQLQVPDGEAVHPYMVLPVDALHRGDVTDVGMLGVLEIVEDRSCRHDAA